MRTSNGLLGFGILFALTSCAQSEVTETTLLDQELADIQKMLTGEYAGQAPKGFTPSGERQDLVHAFQPVDLPQFGDDVIYYQIKSGEPEKSILQAKIFVFSDDPEREANTMRAFVLTSQQAEALHESGKGGWTALEPNTLMSFPDTCFFTWGREGNGFTAHGSDKCSYPSRAFKQTIQPEMRYRISDTQFTMEETLRGEDGEAIVTTGGPLVSERIR